LTDADQADGEALISALSRLSPTIQNLQLETKFLEPSVLYSFLCRLRHLRVLKLRGKSLDEQSAIHLGSFPHLTQLDLLHINIPDQSMHAFTTADGQFPSLTGLKVSTNNWKSAGRVMHAMNRPFTCLGVTVMTTPISDLQLFLESLQNHPSQLHSSLRNITLRSDNLTLGNNDSDETVYNAFKPLFKLAGLTHVWLSSEALSRLENSFLKGIAGSLPALESLEIRMVHLCSKMTMEGLIPLVKNCPRLAELTIQLHVEPFDPTLLDGVCNTNISKINFLSSPINSPLQVFHSLIRMFPNLKSVDWSRWRQSGESWELNRLLEENSSQ
jgi:hypothetical protein